MMEPSRKGPWALLLHRRLATPLREGVMRMGAGRGKQFLRFLVCLLVVLAIAMYFAPKAC